MNSHEYDLEANSIPELQPSERRKHKQSKQSRQVVFGLVLFLVLAVGGVSTYLLSRQSLDVRQRASSGIPVSTPVPNSIPLSERPYVQLSPSAGKELFIELFSLKKPASKAEFELVYDTVNGQEGAIGALEIPPANTPLSYIKTILLGSKSAYGSITYHEGITGGTLSLKFSDPSGSNAPYTVTGDWAYYRNQIPMNIFLSRDEKFLVATGSLFNQSPYITVTQNMGIPAPISGTVVAGPYSIAGVGPLPSGDVFVRLMLPPGKKGMLYGWNGNDWMKLTQYEFNEGEAIGNGRLMKAYIAVSPDTAPEPLPPTPIPNPNIYSNLKGSINATGNKATFTFTANPPTLPNDQVHVIDLALDPGMDSIWWSFSTGKSSPIVDNNPKKWNEVTCGKKLYWRVRSQESEFTSSVAQVTVACPPPFENLSGMLNGTTNKAEFRFAPADSRFKKPYVIEMSTNANMATDVYMGFASGVQSPIAETNPKKWDKFSCGRTLYWTVRSEDSKYKSAIQKATVACSQAAGPFSNLSANLDFANNRAAFNFSSTLVYPTVIMPGEPPRYFIEMSTDPNMATDVYLSFAEGNSSPITQTNPKKWDKFSCGRTLYWTVRTQDSKYKSPISTAQIKCSVR